MRDVRQRASGHQAARPRTPAATPTPTRSRGAAPATPSGLDETGVMRLSETGTMRRVSRREIVDPAHVSLTIDLSLRVGELLLSSGAGAADVSATMQSIARHAGLHNADVDITFTSLSMSFQGDPETPPIGHTRQVAQRDIDYEDLTRVDHLVREVLADRATLREARARLARITSSGHGRPRWAVTLGWGLMAAGTAVSLGGGALVALIALVAAVVIDRLKKSMSRRRLPLFYQQVAGGAVATMIAAGATLLPVGLDPSLVVTASIIVLLAGIGFLGALQDALSGFYVTATARLTEAVLATAGIIAGVSGALSLAGTLGISVGTLEPAAVRLQDLPVMAAGAAVATAAFAFASYAPKRSLLPVGLIGAVAVVISQTVDLGFGRAWSVAFAALFVGLVSFPVASRLRFPILVLAVSTLVPLLPGLSIYRGLSLMAEGDTSRGLASMITAVSVAIALSSGVILGEYVAQPVGRNARRLENRLAGPRLVGPSVMPTGRRQPPTIQVASVEHVATEEVPPAEGAAAQAAQAAQAARPAPQARPVQQAQQRGSATSTDLTDMLFLPLEPTDEGPPPGGSGR